MNLNEFLSQRAVFRLDELNNFLSERGSTNPNTRKSLLNYYLRKGRIIQIRRGLYATVLPGSDQSSSLIAPYLVAAKMTKDSVLGYHTALEFHGKAYSVYTRLYYISKYKSMPLRFQSHEIKGIMVPKILQVKGKEMFGVESFRRFGVDVWVTNLERTFVDLLDRPDLAGSWEEIWRSLEAIEFFDLDQVIEYVYLLENRTTAAKVGFFLEQHKESLMLEDSSLEPLRKLSPKRPHYLVRTNRKNCQWIKKWNLMVPAEILNNAWGEIA